MLKFLTLSLLILSSACLACTETSVVYKRDHFEIEILAHRASHPKSQIILMPPTGGTNLIDKSYARNLCERGHSVHILSHWSGDDEMSDDLLIHKKLYARAYKAIGILVEELRSQGSLGILGTSVGALHASIAASRYPEITKAFVIVGGAHIPSIIANSDLKAMKKMWLDRQKLYKFKDKSEYIYALQNAIELEPLNRLAIKTPKKFGMVIASKDETVPTINQERLASLWKPEKVIAKDNDHFWAIISTWLFSAGEIYDFFDH